MSGWQQAEALEPQMRAGRELPATGRSLPIALLRAREAVMARFRPLLARFGLTEQQWRVIRVLDERGPLDPTELSLHACILTPSMTRILRALEGQGMVSRSRHQTDGRRHVIALTAKAKARLANVTPFSNHIYSELEREFGKERIGQLLDMLEALARTRPRAGAELAAGPKAQARRSGRTR